MWCATCQTRVGHAHDNQPATCPQCGGALTVPPSAATATDQARQLLQSWSTDNPLEMPPADKGSTAHAAGDKGPGTRATADVSQRRLRVDTAHSKHQKSPDSQGTQEPAPTPPPAKNPGSSTTPQQPATTRANLDSPAAKDTKRENDPLAEVASTLANLSADPKPSANPADTRTDPPHPPASASEPPAAADIQQARDPETTTPILTGVTTNGLTHSTSLWGQLLAYVGVLGLTAGGALIVWNGFGHAPVNTPTSWLIATGGQMLLFLGIVTLVSSGLEQTSEDVNRQVRVLGEQLLRIEQGLAGQATAMPHAAPRSGTPRSRPAQPGSTGTTKPR